MVVIDRQTPFPGLSATDAYSALDLQNRLVAGLCDPVAGFALMTGPSLPLRPSPLLGMTEAPGTGYTFNHWQRLTFPAFFAAVLAELFHSAIGHRTDHLLADRSWRTVTSRPG